jgi:beta-galactosidase
VVKPVKIAFSLVLLSLLLVVLGVGCAWCRDSKAKRRAAQSGSESPVTCREHKLFNDNWLFCQGDPAGGTNKLNYEALKPWIMATGSEFSRSRRAPDSQAAAVSAAEDGHSATEHAAKGPAGAATGPAAVAPLVDSKMSYAGNKFDDSAWRRLTLPHDWAVEGRFGANLDGATARLKYSGPVWYRKHFVVEKTDSGKKIYLDVDGAMSYSTFWLNGHLLGGWPYGYASFQLDLTPFLKFGQENVIAVRLESPPESSRWYPGAGIYRNVWLSKCAPVHVAHWGTFVRTPEVSRQKARVTLDVDLLNETAADTVVCLKTDIHSLKADGTAGDTVASARNDSVSINRNSRRSILQTMQIDKPLLWDIKSPRQYLAVTTVEQKGRPLDRYETPFGIRTIKFDPARGFLLNGERVQLNGVCNHHDLGALGAALNVSALARQLSILKEMGCNAIRTSHNPPAPELLELCDRMGFVVMDEAFDCWEIAKRPGDYHLLFADWHEKDLRALIRRDRNHPCVVLWSIGNEIEETGSRKGCEIGPRLAAIVHQEDATRPVTAACHITDSGYNGFESVVDVFGYNYKPHEYQRFHKAHPQIALYGSETASCITSRGEYYYPVSDKMEESEFDFQMNSYDLAYPGWATSPDMEFKGQDEVGCAGGEFVWTGFDYLGEPTPYGDDLKALPGFTNAGEKTRREKELKETGKITPPSRSSYFGIVDLAGFKKDRFYLYQSRWRPELPMAHILPHWTWPERSGQVTPVHVYTTGDEAELFLNGRSLGRKTKGKFEYRLRWDDLVYEPGELKAVAYKDGKEWASDLVKTRGDAQSVSLTCDRPVLRLREREMAFVTASVDDRDGAMVPRAKNEMQFEIQGPGRIVATDNGDATDFTPFASCTRKAFNGKCLAVLQATGPGPITLRARANGLKGGSITLTAK